MRTSWDGLRMILAKTGVIIGTPSIFLCGSHLDPEATCKTQGFQGCLSRGAFSEGHVLAIYNCLTDLPRQRFKTANICFLYNIRGAEIWAQLAGAQAEGSPPAARKVLAQAVVSQAPLGRLPCLQALYLAVVSLRWLQAGVVVGCKHLPCLCIGRLCVGQLASPKQ